VSELYRPSYRRLSAKLVPTFADRGCRVISAVDSHGHILGFIDRSHYFFQVGLQLYSRGWVDPIPDPLLLRIFGSARNRIRDLWICNQELWPLDHRDMQHENGNSMTYEQEQERLDYIGMERQREVYVMRGQLLKARKYVWGMWKRVIKWHVATWPIIILSSAWKGSFSSHLSWIFWMIPQEQGKDQHKSFRIFQLIDWNFLLMSKCRYGPGCPRLEALWWRCKSLVAGEQWHHSPSYFLISIVAAAAAQRPIILLPDCDDVPNTLGQSKIMVEILACMSSDHLLLINCIHISWIWRILIMVYNSQN
jgi:hypothetical protein